MKIPALACVGAAAVAISGCVSAGPRVRHQAPTLRGSGNLVGLDVALLLSKNTIGLFNYTRKLRTKAGWQEIGMLSLEFRKVFNRNFNSVTAVERVEDVKKADLIAVWDADAAIDKKLRKVTVENTIIFYDRDNRKIDTIRGKSIKPIPPFRVRNNTQLAVETSLLSLESAMHASPKLASAARRARRGGSAAARSPAAKLAPMRSGLHSDIDRPNYKKSEKANQYALVIGIEQYSNIPDAEFAERDAEAMREHLLALGYPERNIIYLTGSRAVRSSFEKYLDAWLPRNLDKNSRLFFYFSGHGAPDTKSGAAYLLPWDGDPKFLENTAYPVKRLYAKLNALPAKEIIVAMDSCFSGAGGRSVLARGTRPLVTKVDTAVQSGKLVVFAAAAADEVTGIAAGQGHGLFTYYFLKGLNGGLKGSVSVKALNDYLVPRVRGAARRENRDQTPQLMPEALGTKGGLLIK